MMHHQIYNPEQITRHRTSNFPSMLASTYPCGIRESRLQHHKLRRISSLIVALGVDPSWPMFQGIFISQVFVGSSKF
ncbi:hypothetical protein EYC84_009337 [Monilinia fructicola]|uniref:Uncharacterized protein n=1 Tax=Monilinia fructicola TaxID=38448 RepID=A0A5M9J7B5_MONFR|nr:hypothetical protein EYC84_009337 [Monilinia fructicola]